MAEKNDQQHLISEYLKVSISTDPTDCVEITNHLFDLTIVSYEMWINGKKVDLSFCGKDNCFPLFSEIGSTVRLSAPMPLSDQDDIKIGLNTVEIGRLSTGNRIPAPEKPQSKHKWRVLRLFARDFDEDLMVDSQAMIGRRENQTLGFSFFPFDNRQTYSLWFNSENAELQPAVVSMLKDVRPQSLGFRLPADFGRMETDDTALKCFLKLCKTLEASPHIRIDLDRYCGKEITEVAESAFGSLRSEDWWKPVWYFDFFVGDGFESGISAEETANKISNLSERLRSLNPNIKIILTGADPSLGSAVRWNEEMVSKCCRKIDIFGIQWLFPGVKGWLRGKGPFETESAAGYSAALDQALRITHGMLQNASPDQSIPIALSCWSYLRAPSQNTADYRINFSKQDCFFHASQLNSIIRNSDLVSLAENGPLIGNLGLIQVEGDRIWGSAAYHLQKLYLDTREIVLKVATIRDKPMQTYSWSGIPGLIEGRDIPYIDVLATRSADASNLTLLVLNRHHRKRAHVRVSFRNFADLRPMEAKILRSGKFSFQNTSSKPETVYCASVPLGKYKAMDHVNLDLPPYGIVSMTLTASNK